MKKIKSIEAKVKINILSKGDDEEANSIMKDVVDHIPITTEEVYEMDPEQAGLFAQMITLDEEESEPIGTIYYTVEYYNE